MPFSPNPDSIRHGARCGLLLLLIAGCLGIDAAEFDFNGQTFTVPDGFTVEPVATPPLIERPISADFDEQGNLYVTDSSGSNEPVKQQLETKPHRVVRLEDTDGDGRFDKRVVFADKMMFPEGAMWLNGSLYVSAPPSIWKLTDTDGDGIADRREEWFQGKTLTGCANDLHGPYRGPDGWIYWCKGAFAKQTYQRPGRDPFVTRAAHIFRAREDGTGIEAVMTGGMDNPVDVVFTPGGERIFTTTFFQHPSGGNRDGLVHAIYGGVYGKRHNVIEDHPHTGDVMPVLTHLGPAAPCGLTRYQSRVFGRDYQDNLFACLFNLHKVTRHVLIPNGATFETRDEDFLASDHVDFHPTDVLEDADGSLIVVDTGGWYKICCPTSQLYKPDVLGAIYRIRRNDARPINDPRGLKIQWQKENPQDWANRLNDPRIAVQQRAITQLNRSPEASVPVLKDLLEYTDSPTARRNAVWALSRMEGPEAREAVRLALKDTDESISQAAVHATSIRGDTNAIPELGLLLNHPSLQVRRAAAEALGRVGSTQTVRLLLKAAGSISQIPMNDNARRVLEHSITYALIEIGDTNTTRSGLVASNIFTRRAALISLDQMKGGTLKPDQVTPLLTATNAHLQQVATWIVNRHPEWAGELANSFRNRLTTEKLPEAERRQLEQQLAKLAGDPAIQTLLAEQIWSTEISQNVRVSALRSMALADLKFMPASWASAIEEALGALDFQLLAQAVLTARSLPAPKEQTDDFTFALLKVASDPTIPANTRMDAMIALPEGLTRVPPETFTFLQVHLRTNQPVNLRLDAAKIAARAAMDLQQLEALTMTVSNAGPMEIITLLGAFRNATNEALGLRLVSTLQNARALSALRPENLRPFLTNFPPAVLEESESLLASLNLDAERQKDRLDELSESLPQGDVRRGQSVFNGSKAACFSCHAIGYLGGKLGPDMTRIGQIRTQRDLLEAIVFPSASFVRSYEPVVVSRDDEDDVSGIIRKDGADHIILGTAADTDIRIERDQITDISPGTISVMPSGMDDVLSSQELADLLAFLKATKW